MAAADLARKLDARLVGVGAEMIQSAGIADPFGVLGSNWMVELELLLQDNLKRAGEAFRTKTAGLETEWLCLQAYPAVAMAHLARSADLVIAGGAPLKFSDDYRVAQTAELLLQCGRPVLVVPPTGGKLRGDAVVVAWKDTREARRAVADALPFLRAAQDVVVQEVGRQGIRRRRRGAHVKRRAVSQEPRGPGPSQGHHRIAGRCGGGTQRHGSRPGRRPDRRRRLRP